MRLFFAVPLKEEVQKRVRLMVTILRRSQADCKWVKPENLHMTLNFLGETHEKRIPDLEELLKKTVSGRHSFRAMFDRLGAFPSLQVPRILWIGMSEGADELKEIAGAFKTGLERMGIKGPASEREFEPHLTLGRLRGRKNLLGLQKSFGVAEESLQPPLRMNLNRIVLMRSTLSREGPTYEVIKEVELKG